MWEIFAGLGILGILFIIVIIALIGLAGWLVAVYNKFIVLRNIIDQAFAQIDVQLKRRYDLIPNLVETVKGYAKHERGTFADVAKYRGGLVGGTMDERMAANNMLTQALGKLMAVMEAYPQLKANENFLKLQDELAGTENTIASQRSIYNQTVTDYNNNTQVFPGSIIANMFGFTPKPWLGTAEGERVAPKVKFE